MKLSAFTFAFSGALLAFSTMPARASAHGALKLEAGNTTVTLTLKELLQKLPTVELKVADPVYTDGGRPPLTFDTFRLNYVMALLKSSEPYDEIVFQAADGYSPSIARSQIEGESVHHEAFLAYRVHGRPFSDPFPKVRQGKAMISPAPFYLVWAEGKKLSDTYPWPYQLVRIEEVRFRDKYARIFPTGPGIGSHSPEMRGFLLFKTECIRCHSINLVGGNIGPELNVPKNVLEYWNGRTLRALIKKVSSFRARSKMPDFPQLKDSEIDHLFSYFRYESEHKKN